MKKVLVSMKKLLRSMKNLLRSMKVHRGYYEKSLSLYEGLLCIVWMFEYA